MHQLDAASLRVYVVTSAALRPGRTHRDVALAALEGGASAIQLRAPELGDDGISALAPELAARCAEAGVLFVLNDRPDLAGAVGAGGVHVGRSDEPDAARELLGDGLVLGVSVADADQARAAAGAGADYLGVTVWPTLTKPDALPRGLETVRAVAGATPLPVVGIGGIDASNAREVLAAGAVGVAVVSAVAGAPDMVRATRELCAVVAAARSERGA
jgi:thiamine-phosphate pyrophosphorylase